VLARLQTLKHSIDNVVNALPPKLHKTSGDAEAGVNVYDLRNPDPSRQHNNPCG